MSERGAPERGNMQCSCGRRWYSITREEAHEIGREHDDSPNQKHIVSSLLFVGQR